MKLILPTIALTLTLTYVCCDATVPLDDVSGGNSTANATRPLVSIKLTLFEEVAGHVRLNTYDVEIQDGDNLYQAMLKLEMVYPGNFSFNATYYGGLGHYIKGINGVFASVQNKLFWGLYIFNFFSDVGVDSYYPKNGDHIIWKYMRYFSFNVSVINTTDGDKVLGRYAMNYVNVGTSLYQAIIDLEKRTTQKFNFVTGAYPRIGHKIEAMQGLWADYERGLVWAVYNNDTFLGKTVDCVFPDEGDHIKFVYMEHEDMETAAPPTVESGSSKDIQQTGVTVILLSTLFVIYNS
ncbi:uncharacterized protein [Ptychodera flava]|uniref:uncharacterized protein n=1 Tax=Ptychodera flava TaxID=63121 RepID=UPI00396A7D32